MTSLPITGGIGVATGTVWFNEAKGTDSRSGLKVGRV
jgi:hypothetical protein